jgi:UDP-N-acetylmuramyl tripeptide synthase
VAGKGHENYQHIGTERRPFSDVVCAEQALREREGALQ